MRDARPVLRNARTRNHVALARNCSNCSRGRSDGIFGGVAWPAIANRANGGRARNATPIQNTGFGHDV
eukprot:6609312-Lingulodinium_polyedra.AAC.1